MTILLYHLAALRLAVGALLCRRLGHKLGHERRHVRTWRRRDCERCPYAEIECVDA